MTYSEDRDTFERDIFRPPYLARMLERTGQYSGQMRPADRDMFTRVALEEFWWLRGKIKVSNDITRVWEKALRHAALSRPLWWVWSGTEAAWLQIPGKRLGRL